jgi:hypothetical protein
MTTTLTHRPQQISLHTAVTLRLRRAGWLRSSDGRAWLTRTHGGGDMILAPGAWQWVEPGTRWVVEPLRRHDAAGGPLRLEWQPLPSRWAAWRLVWRNLVDRLRGEAAWDDAVPACPGTPRLRGPAAPWAAPGAV